MPSVMITWMDGKQEEIRLSRDDRLVVKENVLSIARARYPARDDGQLAEHVPLVNVRRFSQHE
jgi:hypothetical protein